MSKRKAHTIGPGRPKLVMGAGRDAPGVFVALDAEAEAGLLALTIDSKGTVARPALARDAIVAYARARAPEELTRCLVKVRARRELLR